MNPEKTAPFDLGQGDDACLLIHGLTGSPWDMRPLGEALAGRGFYVKCLRLPGHGLSPEALLHVGQADWVDACEQALHALRNFRQVFVAGFSMGALLAARLAARVPERVHGLALLAPALRLSDPRLRLVRPLRRLGLLELAMPWIRKTGTDLEDEAARAQAPLLPAFPAERLQDLWDLQDSAPKDLGRVHCPTLVVVARKDHVVPPEVGPLAVHALTAAPVVRFIRLERGFHILPRDKDGLLLAAEVGEFFHRLRR
jgi:carboxylesterase